MQILKTSPLLKGHFIIEVNKVNLKINVPFQAKICFFVDYPFFGDGLLTRVGLHFLYHGSIQDFLYTQNDQNLFCFKSDRKFGVL